MSQIRADPVLKAYPIQIQIIAESTRGEQSNIFKKSENSWAHSAIANPQISLVCQSANRKSTIFLDYLQIANPQISTNTSQLCSKTAPSKSCLCKRFYGQIGIRAFNATFVRRKVCTSICGLAEVLSPPMTKNDWVPKSQVRTFA